MAKAELYKISISDGKILLRVPPQLVGAEIPDLDEIQADLHVMGADYLPEILLEVFEQTSGNFEYLCDEKTTEFIVLVEMNEDESQVFLNIVPPQEPAQPVTMERCLDALKEQGIQQGIDKGTIQRMIDEQVYYEPTVVAQGQVPVHGQDGWAEMSFLKEGTRPKPGAQVNLREMPMLQEVKAGNTLVKLTPSTAGVDGFTITGKAITAFSGKAYRIRPGRNTRYNDDRTAIIATKDGSLCQLGSSLSVEEVKVIDKVDASTGHIRFDGILKIKGSVSDRYSVEATRIDVGGSVGKAKLRASGDIRVKQSIVGGLVQAGGSVLAQSMDDAQVSAVENVLVTDYISASKVFAGNTLRIVGERGYASRGTLQAGNLLWIPNIGEEIPEDLPEDSEEEPPQTFLDAGISINARKSFNALKESLQKSHEQFEDQHKELEEALDSLKNQQLPSDPEALQEKVSSLRKNLRGLFNDLRKLELQNDINQFNNEVDGGIVFVTNKVQPGTAVNVRRMRYNVLTPATKVAYFFEQNGIQSRPCGDLLEKHQRYFPRMPF